jgi:polysaccharide lyase-like protein
VALLPLFVVPSATARHLVPDSWVGDFETGDLSQWTGVQRAAADRVQIVTDPVRDGRYAARFEVRPGDYPAGPTGERAEVFVGTLDQAGTEWYYAWSTLFPSDFVSGDGWKHIFVQWHGPSSSGSAVSFQVWKGRLVVRVGSPYTPEEWAQYDLGPLVRGAWQDFVFHARWAADSSAFVEVWRNGMLVVPRRYHLNMAPNAANYLKVGYYRDPNGHPTVIYSDGMRRGRKLDDVVPAFRLRFVTPPTLRQGLLSIDAMTFAGAKVVIYARRRRATRRVRLGVTSSDGSGMLRASLRTPNLRAGSQIELTALIDSRFDRSVRFAARRLAAP